MAIAYDPTARKWNVTYEKTDYRTDYPTNLPTNLTKQVRTWVPGSSKLGGGYYSYSTVPDDSANQINAATNQQNTTLNQTNTELNQKNTSINKAYDTTVSVAGRTAGGDYVNQRQILRTISNIDPTVKSILENNFKTFYTTEKLQQWNSALGAKPPYGTFDPSYYKQQNPAVQQAWQAAVNNDDLDIVGRYGETNYYLQHYTSQGKPAGLRGNAAEITTAAQAYVETKPTDADLQALRTLQLGVDTTSQSERLLAVPEIAAEWDKAKSGDEYWDGLGKQYFLDANKPDEFAALFRLSQRDQDKAISFKYNVNAGYGITELEDALNVAVGEKAVVDVKKFGALTQNVLKDTIEEMKKAKGAEQLLSIMGGFGGFSEIANINEELSNSILGDSGVGGLLSFTSGDKGKESLEQGLQNITGIRNSATYNWQQWFDNTLKDKYSKEIELGYTTEEAKENIKVEAQFAKDFIDKYLIPRFNTSKSMNEFVDYLDVKQSEQNPFQTQDLLNAATLIADLRATSYIDQLKATNPRYFDSNFYFNPSGDKAREGRYLEQTSDVNADWEKAKSGDGYWAQQAYRFGVDVNDKDAFARMHFQVKGQGRGYDAADDILNASKVSSQIYEVILPALKEEVLKQGTIFGQFIRPEEFADEMLKGLDPNNKGTWQEVLDQYGLSEFKGDINGLRTYVIEALQTGSAQQIREQIKYLNEKRKRPTQELLGVTYIERPEDYTGTGTGTKPGEETELFKVFKSAGYQGTEDEFYEKFFPDVDRSEQTALTKAGTGSTFEISGLNFKDPLASLGTLEKFMAEEEDAPAEEDPSSSSFFSLGLDDEEEGYTKSKSGSQILGEFTSMFKGL
jgi:hypothetical protein